MQLTVHRETIKATATMGYESLAENEWWINNWQLMHLHT